MDNEQRLKELEQRRLRGARLLEAGVTPAEVARQVGVSRPTAWLWEQRRRSGGLDALRRPKHYGRPRKLSDAQIEELVRQLEAGALAAGFPTGLWSLRRVAQLIEQRFAVRLTLPSVRRLLRALGWSWRAQRLTGWARQSDERYHDLLSLWEVVTAREGAPTPSARVQRLNHDLGTAYTISRLGEWRNGRRDLPRRVARYMRAIVIAEALSLTVLPRARVLCDAEDLARLAEMLS